MTNEEIPARGQRPSTARQSVTEAEMGPNLEAGHRGFAGQPACSSRRVAGQDPDQYAIGVALVLFVLALMRHGFSHVQRVEVGVLADNVADELVQRSGRLSFLYSYLAISTN